MSIYTFLDDSTVIEFHIIIKDYFELKTRNINIK